MRDAAENNGIREDLKTIQDRLFSLGANLASDPDKEMQTPDILDSDIQFLENRMDEMDEGLEPLKNFILPGGHTTVSFCHVARCVCRRAERLTVELHYNESVDPIVIQYLNRLSDYLFILSRQLAKELSVEEIKWNARN